MRLLRQRSPCSTTAVTSNSFLSFSDRPRIHAETSVRLGPAASGFEACAATSTRSSLISRNSIRASREPDNSCKPAGTGGSIHLHQVLHPARCEASQDTGIGGRPEAGLSAERSEEHTSE